MGEGPPPADARTGAKLGVGMYAASCSTATSCLVTGNYLRENGSSGALLMTRTASGWHRVETLTPPAGTKPTGILPFEASCPAPGECVVAGALDGADGTPGAFLARQSGGRFARAVVPPDAPGSDETASYFADVSCGAVGDCAAVGWAFERGAMVTLTDATWATTRVPGPSLDRGGVVVRSVSCRAGGSCAAAGTSGTARCC